MSTSETGPDYSALSDAVRTSAQRIETINSDIRDLLRTEVSAITKVIEARNNVGRFAAWVLGINAVIVALLALFLGLILYFGKSFIQSEIEPHIEKLKSEINSAVQESREKIIAEVSLNLEKSINIQSMNMLNKIDEKFGRLDESIDFLNETKAQFMEKFVNLNSSLSGVGDSMQRTTYRIDEIQGRITALEYKVSQ